MFLYTYRYVIFIFYLFFFYFVVNKIYFFILKAFF